MRRVEVDPRPRPLDVGDLHAADAGDEGRALERRGAPLERQHPVAEVLVETEAAEGDLVRVQGERHGLGAQAAGRLAGGTGRVLGGRAPRDGEVVAVLIAADQLEIPAGAELRRPAQVGAHRLELAAGQPDLAPLGAARRLGRHVEHAVEGIGTVERRARAAHQLDRGELVHGEGDRGPLLGAEERHRRVAAVDQRQDAAVQRAVEAAGVEVEVVEAALGVIDPGRELEQLRHLAGRRRQLDLLGRDDGHRRRRLGDPLRPARGRGDGDRVGEGEVPIDGLVDRRRTSGVDLHVGLLLGEVDEAEGQRVDARRHAGQGVAAVRGGDRHGVRLVDEHRDAREARAVLERDPTFDAAALLRRREGGEAEPQDESDEDSAFAVHKNLRAAKPCRRPRAGAPPQCPQPPRKSRENRS